MNQDCRSQDLISMYRDYISKEILTNPKVSSQLSSILEARARFDPELIYSYIEFYNVAVFTATVPEHRLWIGLGANMRRAEHRLTEEHNLWLQRELAQLDSLNMSSIIKRRVKGELEAQVIKRVGEYKPDTAVAPVDVNLLDYFALRYYEAGDIGRYDSTTDYETERHAVESRMRDSILQVPSENRVPDASILSMKVGAIFLKWYLFDTTLTKASNGYRESDVLGLLALPYKDELATRNLPRLHLGLSLVTADPPVEKFPGIQIVANGPNPNVIYHADPKLNARRISFSAGYRLYLMKYNSSFSYIDMDFYFAGFPGIGTISPTVWVYKQTSPRGVATYDSLIFKPGSSVTTSLQSYSLAVRTVLLSLSDTYFLECGLEGGMNSVSYKFNYNYDNHLYTAYNPPFTNVFSDSGAVRQTYHNFFWRPVVDIRARFLPWLSTIFDYEYDYFRIDVEFDM